MMVISLVLLSSAILSTICSPHEFIDACWDWTICVCRIDSNVWRDDNKPPSAVLRAGIHLVWAINLPWRVHLDILWVTLDSDNPRDLITGRTNTSRAWGVMLNLGIEMKKYLLSQSDAQSAGLACAPIYQTSSFIQERNNLSHIQTWKSFVLTSFANNEKFAIINTEVSLRWAVVEDPPIFLPDNSRQETGFTKIVCMYDTILPDEPCIHDLKYELHPAWANCFGNEEPGNKKAALDKARERRENNDGTDSDKADVKR